MVYEPSSSVAASRPLSLPKRRVAHSTSRPPAYWPFPRYLKTSLSSSLTTFRKQDIADGENGNHHPEPPDFAGPCPESNRLLDPPRELVKKHDSPRASAAFGWSSPLAFSAGATTRILRLPCIDLGQMLEQGRMDTPCLLLRKFLKCAEPRYGDPEGIDGRVGSDIRGCVAQDRHSLIFIFLCGPVHLNEENIVLILAVAQEEDIPFFILDQDIH